MTDEAYEKWICIFWKWLALSNTEALNKRYFDLLRTTEYNICHRPFFLLFLMNLRLVKQSVSSRLTILKEIDENVLLLFLNWFRHTLQHFPFWYTNLTRWIPHNPPEGRGYMSLRSTRSSFRSVSNFFLRGLLRVGCYVWLLIRSWYTRGTFFF